MNIVAWLAFGLALLSVALWVALATVIVLLWGKARPIVQTYGPMLSAMMPAAAGTGDVRNAAASSPAATLDRCEYGDHEWSEFAGRWDGSDKPAHYCLRCGFAEQIPGS